MSITSKIMLKNVMLPLVAIAMTGAVACESSIAAPTNLYATEKLIYSFTGGADGGVPYGQLAFSRANLVGTTFNGGAGNQGTVFALTTKGKLTTLHSWTGGNTDGEYVTAGVVPDSQGNLYGTTGHGGTDDLGIIYKLDTKGVLTVLHSFTNCADGGLPSFGSLVLSQGVLYGVTQGTNLQSCPTYFGTAFQIGTDGGNYQVTYVFNNAKGAKNGYVPFGSVTVFNGAIYGTTQRSKIGDGLVFEIDAAIKELALYRFRYVHDGSSPVSGVILGKDGRLYGTTEIGDPKFDDGTVFAVDTVGRETILHEFTGKHGEGKYPVGSLVQDAAGDLFGVTQQGGTADGNGTVYEITAAGTFITLHAFKSGASDAQFPFNGLTIGPDGNLYGAALGGTNGVGAVYKVTLKK